MGTFPPPEAHLFLPTWPSSSALAQEPSEPSTRYKLENQDFREISPKMRFSWQQVKKSYSAV